MRREVGEGRGRKGKGRKGERGESCVPNDFSVPFCRPWTNAPIYLVLSRVRIDFIFCFIMLQVLNYLQ
jgi:hypothetical protein